MTDYQSIGVPATQASFASDRRAPGDAPARFAVSSYAAGTCMPLHADEASKISLMIAGGVDEACARGVHRALPGHVVVKPAGAAHEDRMGPRGLRTFVVEPDMGGAASAEWRRVFRFYRWIEGGPVVRAMVLLGKYASAEQPDHATIESSLWELIDHLLGEEVAFSNRAAPAWLREVREQLDSVASDPPRVSALADRFRIHPVYLTRVFRRHFGCPIVVYLARRRVRHAAALLADTGLPIARVAVETGFCDQAHLSRRFRRELGITPAAYRRLARPPARDRTGLFRSIP